MALNSGVESEFALPILFARWRVEFCPESLPVGLPCQAQLFGAP